MEQVLVALIAAVPATIAALAALKGVRQNKALKEVVHTNHGKTLGEHVEALGDGQEALFQLFVAHTEQDERNFAALRNEQIRVRMALESKDA